MNARWPEHAPARVALLVTGVALIGRLGYAALGIPEYWGDAYHNWLISQLTLEHGGVLTDYKGREVVWEPLYRYLAVGATALVGGESLLAGRLVSLVASVGTCGLLTLLVTRMADLRWGLLAGLTMALAPWPLAYGWMYMPEATASLILVAILLLLVRGGSPWVIPLAAAGAMVRHDATVMLLLVVVWLLATRRRRDAGWIVVGLVAGLTIWSWWAWHMTGRPLAWFEQRVAGSTADAAFHAASGARPAPRPWTVLLMLVQVYAPSVVLAAAAAIGWRGPGWRRAMRPAAMFGTLLVAFTVLITVMQIRFFSYPDPRYVMITVPVAVVCSVMALRGLANPWRKRLVYAHVTLVVVALVGQLPTFVVRSWTLAQDRAVGAFLGANAPGDGRLLVDAPVAIYYSGLPVQRFVAWSQLTADAPPGLEPSAAMIAALRREDVTMLYAFDASFTAVPRLVPGVTGDTAFVMDRRRFVPVYRYVAWTPPPGRRPWWAPLRERVERGRDGGSVWRLDPVVAAP